MIPQPIPVTGDEEARIEARRAIRGLSRRAILLIVAGGLACFLSLIPVINSHHRVDALRANGVHTTATVDSYFSRSVIVSFVTATGQQAQTNVPVGQTTTYSAGEQIAIAYEPRDPEEATLLDGPVVTGGAAPLFGVVALIAFLFAATGAVALWRTRGLWSLPDQSPRHLSATSMCVMKRRALVSLIDNGVPIGNFETKRREWYDLGSEPEPVTVFGLVLPGAQVLVVRPRQGSVAVGRLGQSF